LIIVYINRFRFPKIDSRFWKCTV